MSFQAITAQLIDPYRAERKEIACRMVQDMQEGFLLVRLHTKAPGIEKLRQLGKTRLAEAREKEVAEENLEIIRAFRSKFSLCEVYFFYSHESDLVRSGALDAVSFLDDSLRIDSNIRPPQFTRFITADFAQTVTNDDDTQALRPYRDPIMGDRPGRVGGTDFHSTGLIFRDSELRQLFDPFPYLVKTREAFFKRGYTRIIGIAEQRLIDFANKCG